MMDTREAILVRLEVIAGTVAGIKKVFRNETTTNETDLPAIIVLDANEKADPTDPEGRRTEGAAAHDHDAATVHRPARGQQRPSERS
jgi:hypothetical protein